MNEYGDSEPTDPTSPLEIPGSPAPTWQWMGTTPGTSAAAAGSSEPTPAPGVDPTEAPTMAGPMFGGASYTAPPTGWPYGGLGTAAIAEPPSEPARPRVSHRTRSLGIAAAILLVGGAAGAGTALGFAHNGSSASGLVSGDSGLTSPAPSQVPSQVPSTEAPPSSGSGNGNGNGNGNGAPHHRGGGKPSSYIPPGHASADQQVGIVDINTKLKYESAKAAGTGMILTSDGEILTNNHVIAGATRIRVIVVATGKKYTATVVGSDKIDDVAVLQLTGASALHTITPDTDGVAMGDAVTAVGNAMGAGGIPSAAEGSIIGLNRSITTQSEGSLEGERLTGMIQVDAQVIAGDSGGPLYDAENEVIGMDTAASSSPMQSLGFAIPIDRALSIAQKIENGQDGGNITLGVPGFLGIQYRPDSAGSGVGAVVSGIVRKTPAADLGLVPGDTIVSLSGKAVTSGEQLKTLLSQYRGGDRVSLTWRDAKGASHTSSVTLIDGPAE